MAAACQFWVIRDRSRVSSKSGYVRSAPKATELLRRHEMTRWANCGHRCPLEVKQVTERLIEACYTVSACQQFGEAAMKVVRRQFLHLAAAAATLPALSRFASA